MANFPIINGREYSFSNVRVRAFGKDYFSVKSINYKATKTKGKVYGNGQDLIGKTRGNREYTCDMEMTRREFEQIKADIKASPAFAAAKGAGFGDVDFDIQVTFRETGMTTVVDEISGANIDEADLSNSQGTDASMVKLTLSPFRVVLGGVEI